MTAIKDWSLMVLQAEAHLERHRVYLAEHPRSRAGKRRIEQAEREVRLSKIRTILRDHARPAAHGALCRAGGIFYEDVTRGLGQAPDWDEFLEAFMGASLDPIHRQREAIEARLASQQPGTPERNPEGCNRCNVIPFKRSQPGPYAGRSEL